MKRHLAVIGKAFRLIWNIDRVYPFLLSGRSLTAAVLPLYSSVCVSWLVSELAGRRRTDYVAAILLFLAAGMFLGKAVCAFLDWQCSYRYMRIQDTFTTKNSRKAMKMEYQATEDSEIVDLYTNVWRANMSAGAILENVLALMGQAAQALGCISIILYLDSILLGTLALLLIVYHLLDYRASVRRREYETGTVAMNREADYLRRCMGDPACAKDVRLYYNCEFFQNRLSALQGQRMDRERRMERSCGVAMSFQAVLQMLQTVAMYVVLVRQYLRGTVQIGYFSLAVSSVSIFMGAARGISAAWNQLIQNEVYLGYLDRFQSLPERFYGKGGGQERDSRKAGESAGDFQVEFRQVWFRYPGAEGYALEDVNVRLKRGEIATIVGENGSGKTTFVKLLLGLYRPTRGQIFLNGRDMEEYTDEEYRRVFAPVFQDYQLFAYSIRENLIFDQKYDTKVIKDVLAELHLSRKIQNLTEGIEQCVGKGYEDNGVEFSGGERQKLAIARALLKDSPCLVLDEPTAALDPIAEVALYRQIHGMAQKKAGVFITHRLAGIHFSDQILYFENGRIAEQGSCQELLDGEGRFCEFYQLQAGFYQ